VLQRRISGKIPFEWDQQNLMIVRMFKENTDELIPEIKKLIDAGERSKAETACYILKNLGDESLYYLYEKLLTSDKEINRTCSIDCLIDLDLDASLDLIERTFLLQSKETQKHIITELGARSRSKRAVSFLMRLKGMRSQAYCRKEIVKSLKDIKRRAA
jgi:hypothetical protein